MNRRLDLFIFDRARLLGHKCHLNLYLSISDISSLHNLTSFTINYLRGYLSEKARHKGIMLGDVNFPSIGLYLKFDL